MKLSGVINSGVAAVVVGFATVTTMFYVFSKYLTDNNWYFAPDPIDTPLVIFFVLLFIIGVIALIIDWLFRSNNNQEDASNDPK